MKIPYYNVMLVEDEELQLRSIERHVHQLSGRFRVTCRARNGAEALELLRENPVHLVITDIQMPVMQGLELLERISEQYPHIKVVLLTGYAEFSYAQQAVRAGALDYLLKPVSGSALDAVLQNAKKALAPYYQLEEEQALSSAEDVMDQVRLHLREHYAEDIDLTRLSAGLGFSAAYLTKLFHKYEGCSPSKYLLNLRINEAKQLLADSEYSIREVGTAVGYPDQFYFSNVFRKQTGLSPSAWRKAHGTEDEPPVG